MAEPAFKLQFGTVYWLWLIGRHGLETLFKPYQVLLAHIDLLICIEQLQTYIGDKWVIISPGDAHELQKTVFSKFYTSTLGGHMGYPKLKI